MNRSPAPISRAVMDSARSRAHALRAQAMRDALATALRTIGALFSAPRALPRPLPRAEPRQG